VELVAPEIFHARKVRFGRAIEEADRADHRLGDHRFLGSVGMDKVDRPSLG
jgi:hypothetical protein